MKEIRFRAWNSTDNMGLCVWQKTPDWGAMYLALRIYMILIELPKK